ncbi:MAG: glycosyltransferase family 39 protein [Candidatus Omnitrophica bacterium]|nr:glycosyltransferase family 39 protein [Candidatus Omnitrophota bacterium]
MTVLTKRTTILLSLFILTVAVSMVTLSYGGGGYSLHTGDEAYYLRYASAVAEEGIGVFPELLADYAADEGHRAVPMPPPLRAGFIVPAALMIRCSQAGFPALTYLSLAAFIFFLLVNFHYLRKYFDERYAALGMLLLSFSPLALAMARRGLTESLGQCLLAFSLWLFYDYLRERRVSRAALFVFFFTWALLVREAFVALSLVLGVFLLVRKYVLKRHVRMTDFLLATVLPWLLALAVYVLLGRFDDILTVLRIILLTPPEKNTYNVFFTSGPWFRSLIDFLILSPWVCIAGGGFFFHALIEERDSETIFFLIVAAAVFYAFFAFFPKNVRYVMICDMILRIAAVLGIVRLAASRAGKRAWVLATLVVVLISAGDYLTFRSLFLKQALYDPVTPFLLKAVNIIR